MATPQSKKPENRVRKKKKPPKKFRLTYSLGLLAVMLVVGCVSALFAYNFGKQALEGVNPAPAGIKLPKVNPNPKDTSKPEAKPTPPKQSDSKDFLLSESDIIAEFRARSQQELGNIRRPAFVANADRTAYAKTYVKVDRALARVRDPLAISASADQRIADRIAELRQRVYVSSRSYDSGAVLNSDRLATPMTQSVTIDKPMDRQPPIQSDFRQEQFKPRKEILELIPSDRDSALINGQR